MNDFYYFKNQSTVTGTFPRFLDSSAYGNLATGCDFTKKNEDFFILSNLMEYDRRASLHFNFETNRNSFGSKSNGKLLPRSYSIQLEIN